MCRGNNKLLFLIFQYVLFISISMFIKMYILCILINQNFISTESCKVSHSLFECSVIYIVKSKYMLKCAFEKLWKYINFIYTYWVKNIFTIILVVFLCSQWNNQIWCSGKCHDCCRQKKLLSICTISWLTPIYWFLCYHQCTTYGKNLHQFTY